MIFCANFCSIYHTSHPTYHMLAPAFLSTQACCRRTTPVYYGRRTTCFSPRTCTLFCLHIFENRCLALKYVVNVAWQAQGHYVTDEQCIHIPANMITHCLRNNYIKLLIHYTLKTLLRRFPCGCEKVSFLSP